MAERLRRQFMADANLYDQGLMRKEVDPRFGPIKGVDVGTVFPNRKAVSAKGIHSKTVAGISGSVRDGAFSIVLSNGYKDDQDGGDFFIYTGTGGQEETGFSAGGKQTSDQKFEHPDNASLLKSVETRRPVRVVRGPNPDSKYATPYGYRYDGLYVVERAYMGKSADGWDICQYELRRVPGQRPIPLNPEYRGA